MTENQPASVEERLRYLEGKVEAQQYVLTLVAACLPDPNQLALSARVVSGYSRDFPDPDGFYAQGYKAACHELMEKATASHR